MTKTKTLSLDVDKDGIALLTIDLPGRSMNVVDEDFLDDFETSIQKISKNDKIKGVILTSGKDAFMAGADLRMLSRLSTMAKDMDTEALFEEGFRLSKAIRDLETCGKPVVAAVNGLALGGGFELVLGCHYRIASDNPKIKLGFPEVMVGLLPGAGGIQRMMRFAGIQITLQYATIGKNLSAQEALGFGLLNAVVPEKDLVSKARNWLKNTPDPLQPWDKKGFKIPGGAGAMHPNAVRTMMGANGMAQDKSLHLYPAVQEILSCVYEGGIVPFDTAIKLDSKRFANLLAGSVAPNMIRTLFVNKQGAEKLEKRPKDIEKHTVKTLGILGAGMMGAGIAYVSALAGMKVVLLDQTIDAAEKGKAYSEGLIQKGIARGKTTKEKGEALLGRIHPTTDYKDISDADLVIEAVFEDTAIKADVTKKTEAVIPETTIFASNTSTLPITGLAENSKRPDQFIGIHFFSPVDKMPLVEIILGKKTGDKATAIALDYVAQIRKTPIVVNDSRGFYTSRCFGTYVMEGMAMLGEGIKPALIENAGRLIGMPVGPLAVGDEVSIELSYKIMTQTKKDLGNKYAAHPGDKVIEKLVKDLGRLGRKNGKGTYEYPKEGRKYLWPDLGEHFPLAEKQPDFEEVKIRLLYRQAIEAARCFEEGVLNDPESGDVGAIFGWGFAPWSGGPLSYVDTVGAEAFVKKAKQLAKKYGKRFDPPKLLLDMAKKGKTFYNQERQKAA